MNSAGIVELFSQLRSLGVTLRAKDGRLSYNAPHGVLTPELRTRLSTHKKEILNFIQEAERRTTETLPLTPVARDEAIPLSFSQQRVWFLTRMDDAETLYNELAVFLLEGPCDINFLNDSLNEIIGRHENLRTCFPINKDEAHQQILPHLKINTPVDDLTELTETAQQERIEEIATQEVQQPFDQERGPLLRLRLLRLRENKNILLFAVHHIICDYWSIGLLKHEICARMNGRLLQKPFNPEPLNIQYADFASWERQWMTDTALQNGLQYWTQRLAGAPRLLELPLDRPRPPVQSHRGAREYFQLDAALNHKLNALCRTSGTTLFTALLSGFAVLLLRYSRQSDLVIGAQTANRQHSEIEPLLGLFTNTLALRLDLSANPTFETLLAKTQRSLLSDFERQDTPFAKLIEKLKPERNLSRSPLFQVMFVLQNVPTVERADQAFRMTTLKRAYQTSKYDLTLEMEETAGELRGAFEYCSDLFFPATIRRMRDHFCNLLEAFVDDPRRRVADARMSDADERRKTLNEFNDTGQVFDPLQPVHRLFERRACKFPGEVAVRIEDATLSYQELNQAANRIAFALQKLGVGHESRAGVFVDRSPAMLIALLGVLKAGACYIPLDPHNPPARLQHMLENGRPDVIITQAQLSAALPAGARNIPQLDVAALGSQPVEDRNPETEVSPDNLAYIIYTSGSTGKPKGVQITHSAFSNFLYAMIQALQPEAKQTLLAVTTLSFDIAMLELFLPLVTGGSVFLASRAVATDGARLRHCLQQYDIAAMQATPSTWRLLLDAGFKGDPGLKALCGGEALPQQLAERLFDCCGELWNLYGPTETTIWSAAQRIENSKATVFIGRPIANTRIYILDENMEPAPIGVSGELYIGGDGLARGYLEQPDLTARSFVPDPFSAVVGDRLYRTGDRACFQDNGLIRYQGRVDAQVKIHGFRIEPGEIEGVIARHPAVNEVAVQPRATADGDLRLIAYAVCNADYERPAAKNDLPPAEQMLEQWRFVWDETYRQREAVADERFNTSGWMSSYTGQPVPVDEMREWVRTTVDEVLEMSPAKILEIGCGTGLLLYRLIGNCQQYTATDFSKQALEKVRKQLQPEEQEGVVLLNRAADDFSGIETGEFDVVIFNSVIQYFPDDDYLLRSIRQACRVVRPGGRIYLGDVRSLPLFESFLISTALKQNPKTDRANLRQHIRRKTEQEEELILAPEFFTTLPERIADITHVNLFPRRGKFQNEMSRFRFQAVLTVKSTAPTRVADQALDWNRENLSLERLQQALAENEFRALAVQKIPNARLAHELQQGAWFAGQSETIRDPQQAVDPEEIRDPEFSPSHRALLSWAAHDQTGAFDALFIPQGEPLTTIYTLPDFSEPISSPNQRANAPLRGKVLRLLETSLRNFARENLPDYMQPTTYMFLEALPLTGSGKLDRRALPEPDDQRPQLNAVYIAPRNNAERTIAAIWREVLHLEKVGLDDNFFELGGHSLLLTQVKAKLETAFVAALSTTDLFRHTTVRTVADFLSGVSTAPEHTGKPKTDTRTARRGKRRSLREARTADGN